MDLLNSITFDQIGFSFLAIYVIREAMLYFLPDEIAGPGGWLVDSGCPDCE